jgi:hypothetical protein
MASTKKLFDKAIESAICDRLTNLLGNGMKEKKIDSDMFDWILEENSRLQINGDHKTKSNISGYNLFCKEMFPIVREDHKDTPVKELMTIIAGLWKQTNDDDKKELSLYLKYTSNNKIKVST